MQRFLLLLMLPFTIRSQADHEDEAAWLEFRKSQERHCIFGSSWPVYFGHLYGTSLGKYLRGEKKEPNDFAKKAMKHGKDNERAALDLFSKLLAEKKISQGLDSYVTMNDGVLLSQFRSSVLQSSDPEPVVCMLTPDAAVLHEIQESVWDADIETRVMKWGQKLSLVEVKCPWTQQFKFDSLEEWVADFKEKHTYGYPSAFLQALLYASVDKNCEQFFVLFYFVHEATNMRCMISHRFSLTDALRTWCLDNARDFSRMLRSDTSQIKVRVPSKRKEQVLDWMFICHRETVCTKPEFITFTEIELPEVQEQ